LFVLPYLLIDVHGYSATAAGAAFLPFSVIMGLGSRWSADWWSGSARATADHRAVGYRGGLLDPRFLG
jgi:hypothetical protein